MKMRGTRLAVAATAIIILTAANLSAAGNTEANVLNFALSGSPDTLDPHKTSGTLTFQTIRSIYDTLVEPDQNGVIVPALAESYRVSADSLTWTFSLRHGVTFHNGDRFTSADVKATLERVKSEATASPKASEFRSIASIETPDEYTVVLRLSEPYAPLLSSLASGWGAILPKSLIDSGHDFGSQPVGTGPFQFVDWVRDSKITLEKNPNYWKRGYPKLDMVVMNIITESAVQVQALLAGELDAIYNVSEQDVPTLQSAGNVNVQRNLTSLVMVLSMNTSRPPLNDLRVRQAINYAIDKQTVLDVAYGGGKVIGTFMDYNDPYYVDFTDVYPYNPDRARQLVQETGVGAVELEMALPQIYEPHVRAGEVYQEMLKKVGFNVKLKLVDWSTWLSEVYTKANYDLTVIGHTGKLDPDGRLAGYGTGKTYVRWQSPETAALIQEAARTADVAERKALYTQVLGNMAREVPQVYVGTSYRYIATRSNVTGFHMDQKLDTFDFRYTEKR